ncbi:DNA-3-methyladenine glycosylase family protein [Alicyclobacillus vulcanalis]|uniref:DNA-3-methyladenine glycosylase II n=1 Tax=Alicyclobacillus vulcanalis TaxID=252246 RepID=A0A1N7PQH7_9BACL|nr:DNA-3-methyladenine glycosylase 2 [Alicyclobacillus vulcanalis]SIT12861.1 DNA-3-methyladenine glycosylase II [Alicyclobacillus vulcanalis]
MELVEEHITPVSPYNFGLALGYLRTSSSAILEHISGDRYLRAIRVGDHPVVVDITFSGPIDQTTLHVKVAGERLNDDTIRTVLTWVCRVFSLEVNPAPFHALYKRDPVFGILINNYRNVRPILIADPYEAMLWTILGQQVHTRVARRMKWSLVRLCGHPLEYDGKELWLLPTPRDIANMDPSDIERIGISKQKANTIVRVSYLVSTGTLDFKELGGLEPESVYQALTRIKGIGPWTAECVMMRGLGFDDVIPAGDVGLQHIVGRFYGLGRKATESELRQIAEKWRPWRGWAAFLWWFQLQTEAYVQQIASGEKE